MWTTPYVEHEDAGKESNRVGWRHKRRDGSSAGRSWWCCCWLPREPEHRLIWLNAGHRRAVRSPKNLVVNTKYTLLTFIPQILYEQFRYFFNLYFLLVALSQLFPPLQIGLLFTYIAPLVFVLTVTMAKEAYDDIQRWRADTAINLQTYDRLLPSGETEAVCAQDIRVGHLIRVRTDQRVPADLVLLRTHDASGSGFVRTDQLDGETDWKLRLAVPSCQKMASDAALASAVMTIDSPPPSKQIYHLTGSLTLYDESYDGGCIQVCCCRSHSCALPAMPLSLARAPLSVYLGCSHCQCWSVCRRVSSLWSRFG